MSLVNDRKDRSGRAQPAAPSLARPDGPQVIQVARSFENARADGLGFSQTRRGMVKRFKG